MAAPSRHKGVELAEPDRKKSSNLERGEAEDHRGTSQAPVTGVGSPYIKPELASDNHDECPIAPEPRKGKGERRAIEKVRMAPPQDTDED